ncbi:dual specificity phosphatase, catalytic domain [Ruminiclostridium hungatei]|uniref:Dual specificity phosphatase, catalytic domain n=1 Tax=Ruminiclostridium hungatei TaxID=48256 RepID=A0A1V4SRK3_RUMHU|nr:dual specificity protein phosphatase [Ruminiclostridium hungatei]OPX46413.1 dual specificity phosphatase, catalytic domain [Ruminiclostridium hungatei]
MREIFKNLFCGNDHDYLNLEKEHIPGREVDQPTNGWAVLHACKESHHRQFVGYTGRGCPKDSPEYLWSERGNRLALNIVDAPKPDFFDKRMIDKALDFIEKKLSEGCKVLVHCNQGESRSASICLLYLIKNGIIKGETLEDCEAEFLKVYPEYNPGAGMRGFVREHWRNYCHV